MPGITSFPASAVSREQLKEILADYLALDRKRSFRRLLVTRFGLLALLAGVIGSVAHGLSLFARVVPIGLFLIPPIWAWMIEWRLVRRLSQRLKGVNGVLTSQSPLQRPIETAHKKVIKSS